MGNQKTIFKHVSLKDTLKFFYFFIFSNPSKIKFENIQVNKWLIEQLQNKSEMILVAGELAIAIEKPEVVKEFIEAATLRKKKIDIFCGPKIYAKEGKNELYSFLLKNKSKNLKSFGADVENMPLFHFVVNGRNVCIEKPHLPSKALSSNLETCIISNSILWYNRLRIYFNNLKGKSKVKIEDLALADMEELKRYENSDEFARTKKRILKSQNYS